MRVGVCVADGDRERELVVAGRGDGLRALFRRDDRGYLGPDVERLRATVRLGYDALRLWIVDRRLELDLVAADRVRVGAERKDVDRLPVCRIGGNAHDRELRIAVVGHRLVDGVARRAEAEVVLPVLALHVGELRRDRDVEVVGIGLREIDLENGRILGVGAVRDDFRAVALDNDARRHWLDALHRLGEEVVEALRLAAEIVVRIRAKYDVRRLALAARGAADREVGRGCLAAREGHGADVPGLDGAGRIDAHVDDVVGVDVEGAFVLGPDVERDGVGRRRVDDETGRDAAAGYGRIFVHRTPVRGILVVAGEVNRLHEEAAVRERRVVVPLRKVVRLGERRLHRIPDAPRAKDGVRGHRARAGIGIGSLVKGEVPEGAQRVEGIDAAVVGSRRIGVDRVFRLLRRKDDRKREVAGLRRVLEDELGREVAARGIRHERRVVKATGDVDADLHRLQELRYLGRANAGVLDVPAAAVCLRRNQAYLEVEVFT